MNKRIYAADDESWDIIFDTIGFEMEAADNDESIKEQLTKAYSQVKEIDPDILEQVSKVIKYYLPMAQRDMECYDEDDEIPNDHILFTLEKLNELVKGD